MSASWPWYLKMGALVTLIDLSSLLLAQGQSPQSELRAGLDLLDQVANIMLFSYVGYRVGKQTGRATAGAEAGVITSLLPAAAAAAYQMLQPGLINSGMEAEIPLANRVIASVAFNIVLGGVSAWLSAWLASRTRTPAG